MLVNSILIACEPQKKITDSEEEVIVRLANREIPSPFKFYRNETGQYILCIHNLKEPDKLYDIQFTVIDVTNQQVTVPATKIYGEVKWADEILLKIVEYPRVLKDYNSENTNKTSYLNIITNRKPNN